MQKKRRKRCFFFLSTFFLFRDHTEFWFLNECKVKRHFFSRARCCFYCFAKCPLSLPCLIHTWKWGGRRRAGAAAFHPQTFSSLREKERANTIRRTIHTPRKKFVFSLLLTFTFLLPFGWVGQLDDCNKVSIRFIRLFFFIVLQFHEVTADIPGAIWA